MKEGPGWKQILSLSVAVVVYLCVGAVIFSKIERDEEERRRQEMNEVILNFLGNNSCINKEHLCQLLGDVSSDINYALHALRNESVISQWDFSGAFSFVVTVVTTIGYGNLAPRTGIGKIALVVYAVFGIPMTMILLNFIGQLMNKLSTRVNKCQLCSRKPLVNKLLNMVLIITLGITMLFALPAFVFTNVEKWEYLEALYYCFVTLSTIGFGDYVAALSENRLSDKGAEVYRIVTYIWILFGLSYLALVINYISSVLTKKAEKVDKLTKEKLEAEILRLHQEVSKRKRSVYRTAATVTSSVKGKVWDSPVEDAIENSTDDKKAVTLLRILPLQNKSGDTSDIEETCKNVERDGTVL